MVILVLSFLTCVGWVSKTFEECSLVSAGGTVSESKGNKNSKQACVVAICIFCFGPTFDERT